MGGSTLDLLVILTALRAFNKPVILEEEAMEILRGYREYCLAMSEELKLEDYGLSELDEHGIALSAVSTLTLAQTRHRPTRMRGDDAPTVTSANIGAKYGILSDIPLGEILCLAKMIAACTAQMQSSGERVYRNFPLFHYDCRICAVGSVKDEDFCQEDYKVWSGPRKAGFLRPGLYLRYNLGRGELGCWPAGRIGPTQSCYLRAERRQPPYHFLGGGSF
jgi:hypothetical protein